MWSHKIKRNTTKLLNSMRNILCMCFCCWCWFGIGKHWKLRFALLCIWNSPEINKSFLSFSKTLLVGYTTTHKEREKPDASWLKWCAVPRRKADNVYRALDYEHRIHKQRTAHNAASTVFNVSHEKWDTHFICVVGRIPAWFCWKRTTAFHCQARESVNERTKNQWITEVRCTLPPFSWNKRRKAIDFRQDLRFLRLKPKRIIFKSK